MESTEAVEVGAEEKKDRRSVIAEALESSGGFESEEASSDEELDFSTEGDREEAKDSREATPAKKQPQVGDKEEIPAILPPAELDPEAKRDFEELARTKPELARKFSKRYYDMRRDYTSKTMELAQVRQRYQQLDQVSQAHANRLARKGVSVEQAISNALAWDHFLEEQGPNAALQWLEKHGYDPEELIEARDNGQAHSGRQAQAQIPAELQRELEESRRFRQRLIQQQQAQVVNGVYGTVESFKRSKPIFADPSTAEQIEQAMAPVVIGLASANPGTPHAQLLERAYNMVVNSDERFRALVNSAEKRKTIEAERDRSHRARAASSIAGSGPGTGSPTSIPKGRRNIIAAALDGRLTV